MAKLELKQEFRGPCIICNCMPVDESEVRHPHPMFVAIGRDVNWGEDLNICVVCAGVMADMLGRPDELVVRRLRREVKELNQQNTEITDKFEEQKTRINKILEGKKAQKAQKEAK